VELERVFFGWSLFRVLDDGVVLPADDDAFERRLEVLLADDLELPQLRLERPPVLDFLRHGALRARDADWLLPLERVLEHRDLDVVVEVDLDLDLDRQRPADDALVPLPDGATRRRLGDDVFDDELPRLRAVDFDAEPLGLLADFGANGNTHTHAHMRRICNAYSPLCTSTRVLIFISCHHRLLCQNAVKQSIQYKSK